MKQKLIKSSAIGLFSIALVLSLSSNLTKELLFEKAYAEETFPDTTPDWEESFTSTQGGMEPDEPFDNNMALNLRTTHPECPENQWAMEYYTVTESGGFNAGAGAKAKAEAYAAGKGLSGSVTANANGSYSVSKVTNGSQLKATFRKALCASGGGTCLSDNPECVVHL